MARKDEVGARFSKLSDALNFEEDDSLAYLKKILSSTIQDIENAGYT